MSGYVVCPEKITSPAPPAGFPLPPNLPCGMKIPVREVAEAMDVKCPRGHRFYATPKDIHPS